MGSPLNPLSFIGDIVGGVLGYLGKREQGKQGREKNISDEQMSANDQFASEFNYRNGKRTWFDSLIDGLNRLPRPITALGFISLFLYAPYDPLHFQEIMLAYAVVPEWLALIFGQIILMFFGGRMLAERWTGKMGGVSKTVFNETMTQIKELRAMREVRDAEKAEPIKPISPEEFERQMANPKPLSNAAIIEWNRRNNPNFKG